MKKTIFLSLLLISQLSVAQVSNKFFTESDKFFKTYVNNGRVDYSTIASNTASLDNLVQMVKEQSPHGTDDRALAFYINAYNISVIHGIVKDYPTKSPLKISGFFDTKKHNISGNDITLNQLENGIIREKFGDARIHFALVCAAVSCPPIISEAYTPQSLDQQLDRQTKLAINNVDFLDFQNGKLDLSKIFEWYKEDFGKTNKDLIRYINQYRAEAVPEDAKIRFTEYNWELNAL